MSEAPKPHKKPEAHKAHSPDGGMRRRDFLKIAGKAALVGLGASLFAGSGIGSIGIGKAHAADKKKPTILAQAESNPAVRKELNALQKVSINEMMQIENASEKFPQGVTDEANYYNMILTIPVPSKNWSMVTTVSIGMFEGKRLDNEGAIKVFDKNGKSVWYNIDFTKLSALYKEATSQELKYVKILGEYGKDNAGDYINIHFVPIVGPNEKIQTGTPAVFCTYSDGTLSGGTNYLIG